MAQFPEIQQLNGFPADSRVVKGGRIAAGEPVAAFTLITPQSGPLPVLIAVPHGGRSYFADVLGKMRAPEMCQLRLEDRHVDSLGIVAARETGAGLLVAHAPRAMLDLNRSPADIDWDMIEGPRLAPPWPTMAEGSSTANHRARSGLGLIPRRLPGYGEIWRGRLPRGELDRRIADIHEPYHAALAAELTRIRNLWGAALLIDLHSMPPLGPRAGGGPAPLAVLGDRFGASCHHALMRRGLDVLMSEQIAVAQNRPYSGGYVLDRHGAPDKGVHAIQIELCRSLYLDEEFSALSDSAQAIGDVLIRLVIQLGQETAALGQARGMMEAAE